MSLFNCASKNIRTEVHRLVIHEWVKNQGENHAILRLNERMISVADGTTLLLEKLNDAFRLDKRRMAAGFVEESDALESLETYMNDDTQEGEDIDASFVALTVQLMNRLHATAQAVVGASGGFYVFAEYTYRNRKYIGVYLVRNSEQVSISWSDGRINVDIAEVVDTDNFAMAARFDEARIQEEQEHPINITYGQGMISDYFINWIDAALASRSTSTTELFVSLIRSLEAEDIPIDKDTNQVYTRDKLEADIYNFVEHSGRVVRMSQIGENFWDDPAKLVVISEEQDLEIDMEFRAARTPLKRLRKFEFHADNVKLSFSPGAWRAGNVRAGEEGMVIIESMGIYNEIRNL